jgi:hypothetical protein
MLYFPFYLLGVVPSITIATPLLEGFSVDDNSVLDLTGFQPGSHDHAEPDWPDGNDAANNIFADGGVGVGSNFLSSALLGEYSDGLNIETPLVEPNPPLMLGDSGFLAFSDSSSSGIPLSQAGSSDEEAVEEHNLFVSAAVVAPPPNCLGLDRGTTDREFQSLCCRPPCQDEQSWRKSCVQCTDFPGPRFRVGLLNPMFREP